jgi:cell division protein FtsL
MPSAAPSPAHRRTRPSPGGPGRVARPRHSRATARAMLLLVIVLVTVAFSMAPLHALLQQRSNIAELERQTQVLDRANADLEQRVGTLHDPTELERIARECLGMVKPGETAFVTIPAGGGRPTTDC